MNRALPAACALAVSLAAAIPPSPVAAARTQFEDQDPRDGGLAFDPVVPIHTQPDDPDGGAYGTWAAGRGFKVRFGPGTVELHPAGAAPDGGAWRWTTESIRIGGDELAGAPADARTVVTQRRYATTHATGVTEAYDLREDGVEQSFVLARRPVTRGPLSIVGRVESPWRAPVSAATHGPRSFADDRGPVVDFGRAWALDAVGRRLELATSWDGERIELVVPAAFVAEAVYPLVVDPLIGPNTVYRDPLTRDPITSVDVARDDDRDRIYYAVTDSASSRDDDLRIFRCGDDFSSPVLVYADITTSWSTEHANVATVGGARKCVTVVHRIFGTTKHALRWHTRSLDDVTLGSSYGTLVSGSDEHDWLADVGGSRTFATGDMALISFQRDVASSFQNTATSMAMYALLDVSGTGQGVLTTPRRLRGVGYDQEHPRVTPLAEGGSGSGWPVVWQEFGALRRGGYAWDAVVRRVSAANGGALSTQIAYARTSRSSPAHCLRPAIAGEAGRYMLVYAESLESVVNGKTPFPQGHALVAERVDWPSNGGPTFPHPPARRVETNDRRLVSGGCGYDSTTRSHWVTVWGDTILDTPHAEKLGYRGRTVVRQPAATVSNIDPVLGGVTFDDDNGRFAFGFARLNPTTLGWSAYGTLFTYLSANPPATYGTSCATATPGWDASYFRGDEFSAALLTGAPARTPAFLLISMRPGSVGLSPYGMSACALNLDLSLLWPAAIATTVSARGGARVPLPLPEDFRVPQLFCQWFLLEAGANPLGVTSTSGLRVTLVD